MADAIATICPSLRLSGVSTDAAVRVTAVWAWLVVAGALVASATAQRVRPTPMHPAATMIMVRRFLVFDISASFVLTRW
jgi:hypothetical protein